MRAAIYARQRPLLLLLLASALAGWFCCRVAAAAGVAEVDERIYASVSVFDDGLAGLQVGPLRANEMWVVVISEDVKERVSLDRGSRQDGVCRGLLKQTLRFYPKRQFCLVVPGVNRIVCGEVQRRPGRLQQGAKQFPRQYRWPRVEEIDISGDGDDAAGGLFGVSRGPLVESDAFRALIGRYRFPRVDPGLRDANLQMKTNQRVRVYVSLTTSPSRLPLLHYTLSSLDLTLADRVFVTLPHRFKGGSERYTIPAALQERFPLLTFLQTERDYGPVLKLTGAVQHVIESAVSAEEAAAAERAIFVTIDDDQFYSLRTLDTLVYYSLMNPEAVITAASHGYYSHVATFGWPIQPRPESKRLPGQWSSDCEGFAGVAFRGYHVDYPLMLFFADRERDADLSPCRLSDDMVIAVAVGLRGHPIYALPRTSSPLFYGRFERLDLPNFRDENALHRLNPDGSLSDVAHTHKIKYDLCLTAMQSYFLDGGDLSFVDVPEWV